MPSDLDTYLDARVFDLAADVARALGNQEGFWAMRQRFLNHQSRVYKARRGGHDVQS